MSSTNNFRTVKAFVVAAHGLGNLRIDHFRIVT